MTIREQIDTTREALVKFVIKVANKKRPTKAEVAALPEVVKAIVKLTRF